MLVGANPVLGGTAVFVIEVSPLRTYEDFDTIMPVLITLRLDPKPKALRGTGYFHRLAKEAESSNAEACMTVLLVQKGGRKNGPTVIDLDGLPIEFSISGA